MTTQHPSSGAATEFFRLGLASRTMGLDTIDGWATQMISETPSPSFALYDLAMAKSTDRGIVLDVLNRFTKSEEDREFAWAMFCEFLHDDLISGKRSLKDTIYVLYGLERLHEAPELLEIPITILEDEYALARDGVWGTMDEVEGRTVELLRAYFDDETPKPIKG
jgi:hypothetical protein